ncbi:MAG: putative quinol monooxygenase [Chloroflexota bacterium]
MGTEVSWLLELALNPGALDDFRVLMDEMVASTRDEPGTLSYSWFTNDDRTEVKIVERYVDSDAVVTHMTTFGERYAGRFMAAVTPTRFTIMGSPNDAVKEIFAPFSPTYLQPFGGFAR